MILIKAIFLNLTLTLTSTLTLIFILCDIININKLFKWNHKFYSGALIE
jgi:hypothetical protein